MTDETGDLSFIDTHAHLDEDQFGEDVEAVVQRANRAGVSQIINIGYSPARWKTTVGLAQSFPCLSFTLGLHPSESDRFTPELIDEMGALIESTGATAIGESGLDLFRDGPRLDVQRRSFEAQLLLARDLNLPVVIHQRAAETEILEMLACAPATVKCILHSFEGSQQLVDLGIERGYYFGVGGLMTRSRSQELRDLIKQIPIERLLLETDSPYLMPAGLKGQRNEPAHIRVIANALAGLFQIPLADVANTTTRNAIEIFRLDSPLRSAATMV